MNNKYFDVKKQEKALQWLEEKWPKEKRTCECCGNNQWQLASDLVTPLIFTGHNISSVCSCNLQSVWKF